MAFNRERSNVLDFITLDVSSRIYSPLYRVYCRLRPVKATKIAACRGIESTELRIAEQYFG
jgi:hypothetical protein